MRKEIIKVPKGIRYISEWKELEGYLPQNKPYIMNKTITGCGYTEYCITNNKPVILCSPRLILLENKEEQHKDMENLLYLRNEFDSFENYDTDINKDDLSLGNKEDKEREERKIKAEAYTAYFKNKIYNHESNCKLKGLQPKFLITYDSFRRIREALGEIDIQKYMIIVDEFQSLFCDSRFKSDTENTFLNNIKDLKNVCYLSATPMMDKYLEMLDEFKNLDYFELDWGSEDPRRIIKPYLKTKQCKSILTEACKVIESYKSGNFEKLARQKDDGTIEEVYSKEAVIYVNSVKNICDIIRKCKLTLDSTNVLCANIPENEKKIREAFNKDKEKIDKVSTKTRCIGTIPKEGEQHKMFTLCTRTVYLGADFYSTCARSFIFSDATVECLSVDITLDLPQILGRQRLECNPWKNRAELYYKLNTEIISQDRFNEYLNKKIESTKNLLNLYDIATSSSQKHDLATRYKMIIRSRKYKDDYVAVDEHAGSDLKPIFNNLVMISEMRAFEIQQVNYKDRFSVFSALYSKVDEIDDINQILDQFYEIPEILERYKFLCSLDESVALSCLPHLPEIFSNYYTVLGPQRMQALRYNSTDMKKEYDSIIGNQSIDLQSYLTTMFLVGERYSMSETKKKLRDLYTNLGYTKTPKASDIETYFEVRIVNVVDSTTGKRGKGFEIIKTKD